DYIQREFEAVKQHSRDRVERVQVPLAAKRVEKALRDTKADHKTVFPYAKLVYDKSMGDMVPPLPAQVNIKSIQMLFQTQLQEKIGNTPTDKKKE
ncbi:unnamed protein product, partial [marine sediment metagenome]